MDDLSVAGFITKHTMWSFKTKRYGRNVLYRLSDNYIRFYLKYIEPNQVRIDDNHFEELSLSQLPGFNTMLGLQFENLVLKNRSIIYDALGVQRVDIVADGPYFQKTTKNQAGCQIDLLIQTRLNSFYVCEIKYTSSAIGLGVAEEVKQKINKLKKPRGAVFIPVLIILGEASDALADEQYFYKIVDMEAIWKNPTNPL